MRRRKLAKLRRADDEPEYLGVRVVEHLAQLIRPDQLREFTRIEFANIREIRVTAQTFSDPRKPLP